MFVNGTEIYKFKTKGSEIVATPLCLGNISNDWSIDNMKKKQTKKKQDLMDMYMILVLIMILLMLMIHKHLMKKNDIVYLKIFRFVKKVFFTGLKILSSFKNANSLSCISMNKQECKARPEIINVNSINPVFYLFSIKTSKCSGNCNNINNP